MAAVIPFDRRAAHFVASKPEWLDRTNDIAPAIDANQLAIWTRPDGAVVSDGNAAA